PLGKPVSQLFHRSDAPGLPRGSTDHSCTSRRPNPRGWLGAWYAVAAMNLPSGESARCSNPPLVPTGRGASGSAGSPAGGAGAGATREGGAGAGSLSRAASRPAQSVATPTPYT